MDGQTPNLGSVLLDAAPDAILAVGEDGIITFANRHAATVFGYQVGELVGLSVDQLVPSELAVAHEARRMSYRAGPRSRTMGDPTSRVQALRSDGKMFPVEVSLSPAEVDGEAVVVVVARDVSERVTIEQEHNVVRRALDSLEDAVVMFDSATYSYSYVNDGAVDLLGYSRVDLLAGKTPIDALTDFTEGSFALLLEPILAGERAVVNVTTSLVQNDGIELPIELTLQCPDAGSGDRRIIAIARDLTDKREAADRLRASEARMTVIEDRERIARDLHDLVIQRLFATGMQLQAAIGSPERLPTRAHTTINDLDETIAVIRDTVFQLTTADLPVERELDLVIDRHRRSSRNKIEVDIEGEMASLGPDVAQNLIATINELLSNVSRHARAENAHVTITIGEALELHVVDDGIGLIAVADRGYGLANVARRAKEMNGDLTIAEGPSGVGLHVSWSVPVIGSRV